MNDLRQGGTLRCGEALCSLQKAKVRSCGTGKTGNWCVFTGFRIKEVASGFDLQANLASVPQPDAPSGHFKGYAAFACRETKLRTERSGWSTATVPALAPCA